MVRADTPPRCKALPTAQVLLTGGWLADRCRRNIDNLFMAIDADVLACVYAETHDPWYAEPEFCGHYLDTAVQVFGTTGDQEVMDRARRVVDSIVANQREDGYLGTYKPGREFDGTFSVWNETFTIKGLLSWFGATGDERALDAATRCADRLAAAYMGPESPDLFLAVNQGVENLCLVSQLPRLHALSGKQLYLDFARHLLERAEATALKLLTGPMGPAPPNSIGCLKAGEMLICYAGLVDLHRVTGDAQCLKAAATYWDVIRGSQIGITGNGSIGECWSYVRAAGRALSVSTDLNPNENCVAVTWMKLSGALLEQTGQARYADAMEQTLYNHLLGAQSLDGSDFSYYQGTRGRKVHATHPGQYSCCRYRGMNMLAHLPRFVYAQSDEGLWVNLYCSSEAEANVDGVRVAVAQQTDYPRSGRVTLSVRPERDVGFELRLRIPDWCPRIAVNIDGGPAAAVDEEGYLKVARKWPSVGSELQVELEMPTRCVRGRADDRDVAASTYGPLVLALDSRYGVPIEGTEAMLGDGEADLRNVTDAAAAIPAVRFELPGRHGGQSATLTLVDYASAGSVDPAGDRFLLWLPVAES
jgi:DUF1680 family protein